MRIRKTEKLADCVRVLVEKRGRPVCNIYVFDDCVEIRRFPNDSLKAAFSRDLLPLILEGVSLRSDACVIPTNFEEGSVTAPDASRIASEIYQMLQEGRVGEYRDSDSGWRGPTDANWNLAGYRQALFHGRPFIRLEEAVLRDTLSGDQRELLTQAVADRHHRAEEVL
jgi:hypothetical protein